MSSELKQLRMEMQSNESSEENVSFECASATTELKDSQNNLNELEESVDDATNLLESEQKQVVDLQLQLEDQETQLSLVTDQQLSDLNGKLESSRVRCSSASRENPTTQSAESFSFQDEIERFKTLNQTFADANQQLNVDILQFQAQMESCQKTIDLLTEEHHNMRAEAADDKTRIDILTKSKQELHVQITDLRKNLKEAKTETVNPSNDNINLNDEDVYLSDEDVYLSDEDVDLSDQDVDLATDFGVRHEFETIGPAIAKEINMLQNGIKQLIAENVDRNDRVKELEEIVDEKDSTIKEDPSKLEIDLNALSDSESKTCECQRYKDKEKCSGKDLAKLTEKLTQHSDLSTLGEDKWAKERDSLMQLAYNSIKEYRKEWELKLEQITEKMQGIFADETSKVKEKYEEKLKQLKKENRNLFEKIHYYETHVRQISEELFQLNESGIESHEEKELVKDELTNLQEQSE